MAKITGIRVTITTLGQSKEDVEGAIIKLTNNNSHRLLVIKQDLGLGTTDGWDNDESITLPSNDGWYGLEQGSGTDTDVSQSGNMVFVVSKMPSEGNHFHKWSMQLEGVLCRTDDGHEYQLVDKQQPYYFGREYSEKSYDCNQIG